MRPFCKLMSVSEVRNIKLSRCCIVDPDFGQAKPPGLQPGIDHGALKGTRNGHLRNSTNANGPRIEMREDLQLC